MPSHKSKSGPVKIVAIFTPQPESLAQKRLRRSHKIALLESRIADRTTYATNFVRHGLSASSEQLSHLLKDRNDAIEALSRLGE